MPEMLRVEDLHTYFFTAKGVVRAVNGVDVSLQEGEVLGIVGESGVGKSTLARSVLNAVPPPGRIVRGSVYYRGHNLREKSAEEFRRMRGKDIALILPNPRSQLNPMVPIGAQMANVYRAHMGTSRQAAYEAAVTMLRQVGMNDPERRAAAYPHQLSGGMAQRVVIGIALICSPHLIIADEPTAGLDVTIQAQIMVLIMKMIRQAGASMLLVSRDLGIVAHVCQRVAVFYAGQIMELATVEQLFARPAHPYTRLLLGAFSSDPRERAQLARLGVDRVEGLGTRQCVFRPRCPQAQEICGQAAPQYQEIEPGHVVRCYFPGGT
jgi:oligopeptide/dipeptide ABC transporter ATP-binding protein